MMGIGQQKQSINFPTLADVEAATFTSVKQSPYNAKGDGVTDDTDSIQRALTAVGNAGGGTVYAPHGTYRCLSELLIPDKVALVGDGPDATIFDFDGAADVDFPNDGCIATLGSVTALPDLNVDADRGDTEITLDSAPSDLAAGDVILIYDNTDSSFNPARTNYHAGEFCRVVAISGATITLDAALYDSYLAANADLQIYKLEPAQVEIKELQVIGPGATTSTACVLLNFSRRSTISRVRATGSQWALIGCRRSYDIEIDNCDGFDVQTNAGLNYGVLVGNSQRVLVRDCRLLATRHAITAGGDAGGAANLPTPPVREWDTVNCHLTATELAAWDAHGNCEDYACRSSRLIGGAVIAGDQARLLDCEIWNVGSLNAGRAIVMSELIGLDIDIRDCTIHQVVTPTGSVPGLVRMDLVAPSQVTRENGTIRIIDNHFDVQATGPRQVFLRVQNGTTSNNDVEITGNTMTTATGVTIDPFAGFNVTGSPGTSVFWRDVKFSGNRLLGGSVFLDDVGARNVQVEGNHVYDAPDFGIRAMNTGAAADFPHGGANGRQTISCFGNVVVRAGFAGIRTRGWGKSLAICHIRSNTAINCNQQGAINVNDQASFHAQDFQVADCRGNLIGDNQAVPTQTRIYSFSDCDLAVDGDNVNISASLVSIGTAGTVQRVEDHMSNFGSAKRARWDTQPPTTQTWKQNDITYNRAASVGEPVGWTCTSPGTPGTWSPFGQAGHRTDAQDPVTAGVTPHFIGEEFLETTTPKWYKAVGATSSDWQAMT